MKIIRIHRRIIGGTTAYIRECPTLWIVSRTSAERGESGTCSVRYHKRDYRTIGSLTNYLFANDVRVYTYRNRMGVDVRVRCTYKEYLFLKMNYGEGLTKKELLMYQIL